MKATLNILFKGFCIVTFMLVVGCSTFKPSIESVDPVVSYHAIQISDYHKPLKLSGKWHNKTYRLVKTPVIQNQHIQDIYLETARDKKTTLAIILNQDGTKLLEAERSRNMDKAFAIVVDGEVVDTFTVKEYTPIPNVFTIQWRKNSRWDGKRKRLH